MFYIFWVDTWRCLHSSFLLPLDFISFVAFMIFKMMAIFFNYSKSTTCKQVLYQECIHKLGTSYPNHPTNTIVYIVLYCNKFIILTFRTNDT